MLQRFDIAYMPYSPISESLYLGEFEVHPFYNIANKMIEDQNVRKQVESYFSRFFDYKYDRIKGGFEEISKTITIIFPNKYRIGVDELTVEQKINIYSISHIISFTTLFENGMGLTNSDTFKTYIQSFVLGKEGLNIYGKYFTNYKLYKFLRPLYISAPIIPFYKTPLCECLSSALNYRNSNPLTSRIFRSLELLFYTVSFEDMVTNENRLISLLMSFEVLLGFTNKKEFVEKIEKYIIDEDPILIERNIRLPGNKELAIVKSKTCWWAFDLYDLRSQIVHGEVPQWKVNDYGSIWTRIEFAGYIFNRLFKILLKESGIMENSIFDNILEAYDMDQKLGELVAHFRELNPEVE